MRYRSDNDDVAFLRSYRAYMCAILASKSIACQTGFFNFNHVHKTPKRNQTGNAVKTRYVAAINKHINWVRSVGYSASFFQTKKTSNHKPQFVDDIPLQWRHNGRGCVLNHQPQDCLLNRLLRRRSKKTSKLCVSGLCAPVTQIASNAKHVSIWWRHHVMIQLGDWSGDADDPISISRATWTLPVTMSQITGNSIAQTNIKEMNKAP